VNPLTDFIDQMAVVNINYLHQSFAIALEQATSKVERVYGLSTDPSQLLGDYSRTGTDGANLGLILGALINEDQILCPESPGGLVTALASDLADGALDGMDANGASIDYCGGSLAAIAGTSIFEDSLSGLQQLQMISQGFAFGGTGNSLTANGLVNIATGGSVSYPLAPLALINSAIGPNASPASVNAFAPSTPSMNEARATGMATLLPNGKVLIAGGTRIIPSFVTAPVIVTLSSTEIYDPVANTFAASTPSMNQARCCATATSLPNGKVLIAGGQRFDNSAGPPPVFISSTLSSTELYDPQTNTFAASTPSMNQARCCATATLLPNGKVLIAGGSDNTGNSLSSTDIYDPATDTFAGATPSMNQARSGATATLLPNGRVLIAGGSGTSTEIYDPARNTFAASTPSMNQGGAGTATLLPNGKVLITHGSTTDIYDPVTNTFAASTPSMNHAGTGTATLLPNGKVLIPGVESVNVNVTEIYDPVANTFASGPSIPTSVAGVSTLLPNGKVLIAGGEAFTIGVGGITLNSTAIYTP
jgi:hypothetical protein